MNPANGIKIWTNGAAGGFKDINDNDTALEIGKWYYLAYTHTDENNGLVVIYLDGEETRSEESGNPVAPAQNTSAVTIGTWGGEAWTPVEPEGKLATSWANIKLTR